MNNRNLVDTILLQVQQAPSFQRIMQDGVVSDDEIVEQAARVEALMRKTEETLSPEDFALVSDLITELAVFQVITNINNNN